MLEMNEVVVSQVIYIAS